jgi:VWFA-related protein
VLDDDRRPVRGLIASDFTLLQDGVSQPILAFAAVDLPLAERPSASWLSRRSSDVDTNQYPTAGRVVGIVMPWPTNQQIPMIKRLGNGVVDELASTDLAAVVYAGRGVSQNFTSDKRKLRAAVDHPMVGLSEGEEVNPGFDRCGTRSLEAMTLFAKSVLPVPGRRKILFFVGSVLSFQSTDSCALEKKDARNKLFEAARAANLTIYTLDPSGLETLAASATQSGTPNRNRSAVIQGSLQRQGNLMVLPDLTGGRAILNANDPNKYVPSIFEESRSYYVLGLRPIASTDPRAHITVTVNRPHVTVHARGEYESPGTDQQLPVRSDGLPPSLADTIDGFWPKTDIPLTVTVLPFALDDSKAAVVVVTRLQQVRPDLAALPRQSLNGGRMEMLTAAFDRFGKAIDYERQDVDLPATAPVDPQRPYEVVSRLTLKRGRYDVRVAVEDSVSGRRGSVHTDVVVPDFANASLSLSGLMLSVAPFVASPSATKLDGLMPLVPTVRREFARTERLTAFVRTFQGGKSSPVNVHLSLRILSESDRVMFSKAEALSKDRFAGHREADFQCDLPLTEFAPGEYLLSVEARVGGREPEIRELRFRVK